MLRCPRAANVARLLLQRNKNLGAKLGPPGGAMRNISGRNFSSRAAVQAFPGPEHDHGHCSAQAIARAEALCTAREARLTPLRRQVLEVLAESHQPLGAYDVMDRLARRGPPRAPITVYRALEFLTDNGLVHRIESRNAFLACAHDHDAAAMVAFLICERCGSVGEIPAVPVAQSLNSAARAHGFTPKVSVAEITGICAHCQSASSN